MGSRRCHSMSTLPVPWAARLPRRFPRTGYLFGHPVSTLCVFRWQISQRSPTRSFWNQSDSSRSGTRRYRVGHPVNVGTRPQRQVPRYLPWLFSIETVRGKFRMFGLLPFLNLAASKALGIGVHAGLGDSQVLMHAGLRSTLDFGLCSTKGAVVWTRVRNGDGG